MRSSAMVTGILAGAPPDRQIGFGKQQKRLLLQAPFWQYDPLAFPLPLLTV